MSTIKTRTSWPEVGVGSLEAQVRSLSWSNFAWFLAATACTSSSTKDGYSTSKYKERVSHLFNFSCCHVQRSIDITIREKIAAYAGKCFNLPHLWVDGSSRFHSFLTKLWVLGLSFTYFMRRCVTWMRSFCTCLWNLFACPHTLFWASPMSIVMRQV